MEDSIIPINTKAESSSPRTDHRLRRDSITKISPQAMQNEVRATDAIEPVHTTSSSSSKFDVQSVYRPFLAALREPSSAQPPIGTQDYINGYRELMKFIDQLGYVFSFVKDDVVQKLTALQDFVDKDRKHRNYDTIQSAINYEITTNLIKTNPTGNFARTLLRLHRALIFIEEFLRGLGERPEKETAAKIASDAYRITLAEHHNFLIRSTVKVGFHAIPSRTDLDKLIFGSADGKKELINQYKDFVRILKQIYDVVEQFYVDKKLTTLP